MTRKFDTARLKASKTNTGAITINWRKTIPVTNADGEPLRAGDIAEGDTIDVDTETGVARIIR